MSVIGGGELQNKKISIRGLDGFRVIQQVDGAQRLEPEMLSQIDVQNGADSMSSSVEGMFDGAKCKIK